MSQYQAIIDLANDITQGRLGTYSVEDANEKLRVAINKAIGCEDGKFNHRKFHKKREEVFEIILEALDESFEVEIRNQFDQFVDIRSTAFGDKLAFIPRNDEMFRVDAIAGGNNNLQRQRIVGKQPYTIPTGWYGVKFYEELERFLAGRVDWADLVSRLNRSFVNKVALDIYQAIQAGYSALTAPYKVGGTYEEEKMTTLVEHVRAATGMTPAVFGTLLAIKKAVPSFQSDAMKGERNANGYFKIVDGIQYGVIPQAHKAGTDEFAIDNNFLLVVPNGDEKLVKMVIEGEALIKETTDQNNHDDTQEYMVRKKYGVAAEVGKKYGVYILS